MASANAPLQVQSTAGAIPVVNEKGEVSMQKVKVHRYVSGKRPEYAPASSSEEESEDEDFLGGSHHHTRTAGSGGMVGVIGKLSALPHASPEQPGAAEELREAEQDDPRLRRLLKTAEEPTEEEDDRVARHRYIHAPEVIAEEADDEEEEEKEEVQMEEEEEEAIERVHRRHDSEEEEEEEEQLSEEEIHRRRAVLRQKALCQSEELELLDKEDEGDSAAESEEESSDYEEYTDSEEDAGPRLKPVFVRKRDRITVLAKEREAEKQRQAEVEAKKVAEDRKRQTLKMVEEEIRKETAEKEDGGGSQWNDVMTDDENDEVEYETWKLRELKRVKRDKEERESLEKERMEIERVRGLTEEERRQEFRSNPKLVTNKGAKGKYKFLQKYYHRGAFFMHEEEDVYRRDFSAPTLEDVFDKTILPKVMQVKNFGRSGRTKYTHLVDQDTTLFDSPWVTETAQNLKFHNNQSGGMKQVFDRPTGVKRKKSS